jgi:NADPH-dependent F420 reductase
MKIGIVGGTGNMGKGLALRWCPRHEIYLGSRDQDKARSVAGNYDGIARGYYGDQTRKRIQGNLNAEILKISDVIVITLPAQHMNQTIRQIRGQLKPEQVVISTVVPMTRERKLFKYLPFPSEGEVSLSAAEIIAREVEPIPVVSAFQTVPASYLADVDSTLNIDVLISGDNEDALKVVSDLVRDIPNLRPLRVGPLVNSKLVESITPLLLNAAILNDLKDPSIRIVPWLPSDFEKSHSH